MAEGIYTEESMRTTVVPNRNMILLALATGHAISVGRARVAYAAAPSGDHAIYPDCRRDFRRCHGRRPCGWRMQEVELLRPLRGIGRRRISRGGGGLAAPLELTWSCYKGGARPTAGAAAPCIERRKPSTSPACPIHRIRGKSAAP